MHQARCEPAITALMQQWRKQIAARNRRREAADLALTP